MATFYDIATNEVNDVTKMLYVFSLLFCLYNYLFLVRVFDRLSFLVKMLNKVVYDVQYFLVLFLLFVTIFAECFSVLGVDVSSYGRVPHLFAYYVTVVRIAFGDFGLISTYYGFDIPASEEDPDVKMHSSFIVVLTNLIFIMCTFSVCMLLINFIIALISKSYDAISTKSVAYSYKEKIQLINEVEELFTEKEFNNNQLFPHIVIIRKKK